MGCGKSSVGRKLSQLLCCPFMDLDEMIEDEAGKSIPEIFAEVGERGFRQMELRVLSSVLSVKTEEGEDRATRGTKAGGPQAKRSGGVSEANVRASMSLSPVVTDASSRINVTDNSALGLPRAVIRMACSKGTYVRAFARDLGEALGSGAHLDSLQRSRSGEFKVADSLSVEQAIQHLQHIND